MEIICFVDPGVICSISLRFLSLCRPRDVVFHVSIEFVMSFDFIICRLNPTSGGFYSEILAKCGILGILRSVHNRLRVLLWII